MSLKKSINICNYNPENLKDCVLKKGYNPLNLKECVTFYASKRKDKHIKRCWSKI